MVHTTDPWEKLISLCIMLLEMSGDAVGLSRVNSIVCDCVMFTWSWFQEKTHFNTLVYDINLKFGGVNIPGTNSDQMNQMRSEVLRTCGNFHYFRVSVHFLRTFASRPAPVTSPNPQPEVPKIDGFGARPLGDGKPRCWFASSFDPSFKINPYFKKAKGVALFLMTWTSILLLYYLYIYVYMCVFFYFFLKRVVL